MSEKVRYSTNHRYEADEIREGDPYELSQGIPIRCSPTGGRGSDAAATGAAVLKSDPAVDSAGVDTGYSPAPDTLRAPDVAVGNVPPEPGWVRGVPPLAVEYADTGQDETDLAIKIRELLAAGTQWVWVVRLTGPRRVEIYQAGHEMRLAHPGEELEAPGILRNPVPVEALYDWQVGSEITLRNLLQRHGYESLEAIQVESRVESLLAILEARGLQLTGEQHHQITALASPNDLSLWIRRAAVAEAVDEVFADD